MKKPLRLKILCCEVCTREISALTAICPNICEPEFLPKRYHDLGTPEMRVKMQEHIDGIPAGRYDAILLVYGLCNNGTETLKCDHTRMVIPRAHDCITMFMGSRKKYLDYFNANPGSYYLTSGWIEHGQDPDTGDGTISQKLGLFMKYEELVAKYGEENADYVMEVMGDSTPHYDKLSYIAMGLEGEERFRAEARADAAARGWSFEEVTGSLGMLRKLLWGEWDDDFLVLEPGETFRPSYDDGVIRKA